MHVLYLSLWAAFLVHISWTQAAIQENSDNSDITKLSNLTHMLLNDQQQQMTPLNLRLHDVNYSTNSDVTTMKNIDLTNTLRLKDMLNVFDLNLIASQWINIKSDFSANCSQDIYKYLQGLSNGTLWSVKSKFFFSIYLYLLNLKEIF